MTTTAPHRQPAATASEVARRLTAVRARIAEVAAAADRDPGDISLLAISKTWPLAVVDAAVAAGQTAFGENRAQELRDKAAARPDLEWHFVGRLQTNKVKYVVGTCRLVHSVDRFDLGEAIAERAARDGLVQDALVQVNVDDDPAKAGVAPAELPGLLDQLDELAALRVAGLTVLPRRDADPAAAFAELRRLRDRHRPEHPDLVELSMGMSADYEHAVREGATILRLGEAVFGPRTTT